MTQHLRQSPTDCSGCGVCCHTRHPRPLGFLELEPGDLERLPRDFVQEHVVWNERRRSHLIRGVKSSVGEDMVACPAATGTPGVDGCCSIYESRPAVCRRWAMGNKECLRLRDDLASRMDSASM